MSDEKSLPPEPNRAIVKVEVKIWVSRADLEHEHSLLIARLHLLRKQLGYAPLTDKEQRRQANK